jgi:hypothetical protein
MPDNESPKAGGIGNIQVKGEKLLLIQDALGWEKVRAQAEAYKVKAMGMLQSFLFQPQPQDIAIDYQEKRYQAFWHIVGTSSFEYKRRARYQVPVETVVQDVAYEGREYPVNQKNRTFEIEGVERCKENYMEEIMVDAQTDQPGEFKKYLQFATKELKSTDELTADGTPVVNLEAKASFLVRKILNQLVKPIKADEILDEQIGIEELSLYFYPVYTFEFYWQAKDKRSMVEFDGVTGEVRKGRKITDHLRNSFTDDELFDFAKEVVGFIPGGGLAMLAGRKAIKMATKKD